MPSLKSLRERMTPEPTWKARETPIPEPVSDDLKAEIAELKRRVQQLEDHNRMTAHGDLMNMRIG